MSAQQQGTQRIVGGIAPSGLRRPNWICRNVHQHVIMVRDNSISMMGKKARDATAACADLTNELAQPSNKDGFYMAIVDFAISSRVIHPLEKASVLDGQIKRIKPRLINCGTNITAGLKGAMQIIEAADRDSESGIEYLRPVCLIFTDGQHNTGPHPADVARQLRQKADLVTVAFGSDVDEALLRDLATTPQHFYRCASGRELRCFLAAVGATMTATMEARSDATQALTMIRQ